MKKHPGARRARPQPPQGLFIFGGDEAINMTVKTDKA